MDAFKIGSGELTDIPFISKVAKINKPMIISTGMATPREIDYTLKRIKSVKKLIIMNCLSEYPPKYEDLNLNYIRKLKKKYPKIIVVRQLS